MTIDKNIKLIKNKIDGFSEEPHYEVEGEKIYQKVSALKKAYELCNTDDPNEIWGRVKFRFGVDVQGQEPKEDIQALYRQRAETIRSKFDYVRVWASGGNDSTHTLESFIDAGVQPDELVTYQSFTGSLSPEQNIEQNVAYTAWLEHKKMHSDGVGMPIENWRVVDIDNLEDWKRAEILGEVIDSN